MDSTVKVSIIMPTYNVEKYFRECLDSVVNQTLKDIEIIPVDDGSPDNCGKIMDEYASKDIRIKPIHKKNGGYGSAVNCGIEKADGKYIAILETDDWVEPDMYEILYNNAEENNSDVVKCNFYKYNSKLQGTKKNRIWKHPNYAMSKSPDYVFSLSEYKPVMIMHASVWAGIYKSEFVKKIKFIESGYYQDLPFFIEVLCRAKRISIVKRPLVHYRMEEGQQSSTLVKDKRLLNMARMGMKAKEILKNYNLYNDLKEELYYHLFLANYGFYINIDKSSQINYFILLKELFIDIDKDENFKYSYFDKKQKEFVKYIINTPYIIFILSCVYKGVKKSIFYKYDNNIYRSIIFFSFIRVTLKPARLQLNAVNNNIISLKRQNNKINKKLNYLIRILESKIK